ncbi:MAG: plectrovirus SVGII3 orf 2 transmembrane protein [Mycoplasmataceae bacterium RV_VA103A]|nr:MAG: plectrovirus SVGII3 orf 2 transmembrane protein [Mycoplasmataceae bacterium RV_VA103A]
MLGSGILVLFWFFPNLISKVSLLRWIQIFLSFAFHTIFWATLGLLAGGILYSLLRDKGVIIIDNTQEFITFCERADSLVFYGPVGQGKTSLLAMLAQELSGENKYATFPCNLPWMDISQMDFAYQPKQPLGVKETIFLDEINLLFKGNIVHEARAEKRFLSHFFALSRHQGTKIILNGQRLGQVWIELREVATAVCQVEKLALKEEGLYVRVEILMATAWETKETGREFIVFVPKIYLDTFNSTWLRCLKYLRKEQGYI